MKSDKKSMRYDPISRRFFLVSAGGHFLALPFLSSLLSRELLAQSQSAPKRFIGFTNGHCAYKGHWPDPSIATQVIASYSHPLSSGPANVKAIKLSDIPNLAAAFPLLNSTILALKDKMTVIAGLDNTTYGEGHNYQFLTSAQGPHDPASLIHASIDQVLAYSSKVYPSLQPYTQRFLNLGFDEGSFSFRNSNGTITNIPRNSDPQALFNAVFKPYSNLGSGPPVDQQRRTRVVDLALQAFNDAKNSTRLSSYDKGKLQEHFDLINDLEKKVTGSTSQPLTCTMPTDPSSVGSSRSHDQDVDLMLEMLAAAITCGMTQVGMFSFESNTGDGPFSWGSAGFHNGWIHNNAADLATSVSGSKTWQTWIFSKIGAYLQKLDSNVEDQSTGRTVLDNSLVMWCPEGGVGDHPGNHLNVNYQPIIWGSLGGYIKKSGHYVSYPRVMDQVDSHHTVFGAPINQMLVTILQGMGLSPTDYEIGADAAGGFGCYSTDQNYLAHIAGGRRQAPLIGIT